MQQRFQPLKNPLVSLQPPASDACQRAALSYVLGLFSGLWFLIGNRRDPFIRFHALQSIAYSITILAILFLVRFVLFNSLFLGLISTIKLTGVLFLMMLYVLPFGILYSWIFLIWKAYRGERAKAPFIGNFIEQKLGV